MARGFAVGVRVRTASLPRSWCWTALVLLVGVVAGASAAEAGSLDLTWTAPSTNADATPLTDLAGYRIYMGTALPACPGTSFRTVSSSTPSPAPGQTVTQRVSGLTAGVTYFARVTAVDAAGNESACSASASGVARADFSVSPSAPVSFGSITSGTYVDRSFTVQNIGAASLSGTASVGAPFSIASGGSFSLAPGGSQAVVVRFRPTTVGSFAGNVNFTANGDTISVGVSGSSTAAVTVTLSVTKNGTGTGAVTSSPAGIACGTDCTETVTAGTLVTLTAAAASGSTFAGWSGACTGTATCALTLNANSTVTATFNTSAPAPEPTPTSAPVPVATSLSPSSAIAGAAGFTLTVNGSGFVTSSVVQWNGAARTTTFVSANQLRATITASDLAAPGSVPVSVFTPSPGGGTSGMVTFTVTAPPTAQEIVIDNADLGVQDVAGGRTFTGKWCLSSATNKFGPNALYSCGGDRDTYRWTPTIPARATYDVYVWLSSTPYRSTKVQFIVAHAGGSTTRRFNERTSSGRWVLHGRYTFNAGTAGYVETSDQRGNAGADAVRFVPVR